MIRSAPRAAERVQPRRGALAGWPSAGLLLRAPARRFDGTAEAEEFGFLAFQRDASATRGRVPLDRLPLGSPSVLLLAPEDVLLTHAQVPPIPQGRLRDALPNLLEDVVLGDAAALHVVLGPEEGGKNVLAAVNRAWLRRLLDRAAAAGQRITAVLPEALCVPLAAQSWSLVCSSDEGVVKRVWLRHGVYEAQPLPLDPEAARVVLELIKNDLARGAPPSAVDLYVPKGMEGRWQPIAAWLAPEVRVHHTTPLRAWIAQGGPFGNAGMPVSLLHYEFAERRDGQRGMARWWRAALLLVALVLVQVGAMQWHWAQLRSEAEQLRADDDSLLRRTFPSNKLIEDALKQMNLGVSALRASAGRSDRGDFSAMITALARVFGDLQVNALRSLNYEARTLKIQFAPTVALSPELKAGLTKRALTEGYELRFEGGGSGPSTATLRPKEGA